MQIPQQYYGAEMQDLSDLLRLTLRDELSEFTSGRFYTLTQKVLADTYYIKYTQPLNERINPANITAALNYTPVVLQAGRGGPGIGIDPLGFVQNDNPAYDVVYSGNPYNANNLNKIIQMTDVSSSPAGDVIEVTAKFSLILTYPETQMIGTFIP